MTIKHKFKPAARADIRERVELKFRARGAVAFHLLVMLGVGFFLAFIWPDASAPSGEIDAFLLYSTLYGLFCTAGALHFLRYYFRHGRGRARYEADIEGRVKQSRRLADPKEADEREELIRIQALDQLKNRRLVWQHLAIFAGIALTFSVGHTVNLRFEWILDWGIWRDVVVFFSIWGIGLAAHILRYVFAYRVSSRGREAQIEQQLERELRRQKRQRLAPAPPASDERLADAAADRGAETSIEDLLRGQSPHVRRQQSEKV